MTNYVNHAVEFNKTSVSGGSSDAKTSGLAIAALVLGILTIFTLFPATIAAIIFAILGLVNIGRILITFGLCVMVVPAVIFGIVVLVKIGKSTGQLKGKGLAIAGVGLPATVLPVFCIMLAILMPALAKLFQPVAKRALPPSATDIHEYSWQNYWFVPDYCYFLKAKITQEEFEAYKTKLKFVPIPEDAKEEVNWCSWEHFVDEWWDPLPTSNGAFYHPESTDSKLGIMKYENGYLYYMETVGF